MSDAIAKHPIPEGFTKAHVTPEDYRARYAESISDPDGFWGREGKRLDWIEPYTKVKNTDFTLGTSRSSGSRTGCSTPA